MNKRNVILWYASLSLFAVALIPFVNFMYTPSVRNLCICFASISITGCCYVISTKLITHKKGYTAIQAMSFYKACKKEGLDNLALCKKRSDKIKELAEKNDYSKKLPLSDLYELYSIGAELSSKEKKGK